MTTHIARRGYRQVDSDTTHSPPSQKCDAKHPCTRCVRANRALECEYEIVGAPSGPSGHLQFLIWNKPGPSSLEDVPARWRWPNEEGIPGFPTKTASPTIPQQAPVPPARALIHIPGRNSPSFSVQPKALDDTKTQNPPRVVLPPFSALLSLIFPRIPPEPHVTLSFLGAERFQISDVALGELDMKLYVSRTR